MKYILDSYFSNSVKSAIGNYTQARAFRVSRGYLHTHDTVAENKHAE